MTFYLHAYPFGSVQSGPYPRLARRWIGDSRDTLGVNVHEQNDTYILTALVPGLKAEDLQIQILDDVIRIQGEYKADGHEYLLHELPHGSFTRTLRLPAAIDADHAEAKIADGVLTLRLPKAESARRKRIPVKFR